MGATRWGLTSAALVFGLIFLVPTAAFGSATGGSGHPGAVARSASTGFNQAGNLLITDQYNNRVIEVNPLTKQIVWSFGSGNSTLCNPGPGAVIGANDAERLSGGLTLIAGTGIPSGVAGTTACVDNRVIVVNQAGGIVWQYGVAGKSGSGFNRLNVPVFALELPNHHFLIVDQGNNRVIEVNKAKHIVWSYGPSSGPGALNNPNSAEQLANGDVLIADENNNRVLEVNHAGGIVSQFSRGLSIVAFVSRLSNGDTLVTDAGHNRVVLLNSTNHIVFQFATNRSVGSNPSPGPSNAVMLAGGDIVISDQNNNRVIVVNPTGHIVFQYGKTNFAGTGFNELFGPYTAFANGDYTGQTAPPSTF
ncbi:MAG: PQQ-binding-like beta-propeller repeat protein [Thermoplasmata archaeon]|nr:PQQ-binding-like beta-propeller repeat protein [Thermoplasmata archaeon]